LTHFWNNHVHFNRLPLALSHRHDVSNAASCSLELKEN
jgi:hypothetical protein